MLPSPLAVVQSLFRALENGDRLMMMALCAEDMTFTFNADPDRIGGGATLIGWTANLAHLDRVRQHWEQLEREVLSIKEDAFSTGQVNVRIRFVLRHRASGETFEGTKRQSWIVQDGVVKSMNEVFDQASVHVVQRLAALTAPPQSPPVAEPQVEQAGALKDR